MYILMVVSGSPPPLRFCFDSLFLYYCVFLPCPSCPPLAASHAPPIPLPAPPTGLAPARQLHHMLCPCLTTMDPD